MRGRDWDISIPWNTLRWVPGQPFLGKFLTSERKASMERTWGWRLLSKKSLSHWPGGQPLARQVRLLGRDTVFPAAWLRGTKARVWPGRREGNVSFSRAEQRIWGIVECVPIPSQAISPSHRWLSNKVFNLASWKVLGRRMGLGRGGGQAPLHSILCHQSPRGKIYVWQTSKISLRSLYPVQEGRGVGEVGGRAPGGTQG